MTSGFADSIREHLDSSSGPLVVVQLGSAWLERDSAPERMAVERLFAERSFRGTIQHPVLRFVPHAPRDATGRSEDDPRDSLAEWLRVIAASKLLAGDNGARITVHRVISDRLHLADGVYPASGGDPAHEFTLAQEVSHDMEGLTRLVPGEFAGFARRDNDSAMF